MSKFAERFADVEKAANALAKKGWKVLAVNISQELDDKPVASLTVQFDPQLAHDIL